MIRILALCFMMILAGCASMLPSIQSQHPSGYDKLTIIVPACKDPDLKTYNACLNAADMLESASSPQATSKFIAHWDQSVFGDSADMKRSGTMFMAPERTIAGGKMQRDQANAISQISIPVLKSILEKDVSAYGIKMRPQVDIIIPMSRETLNTFREVHSRSL